MAVKFQTPLTLNSHKSGLKNHRIKNYHIFGISRTSAPYISNVIHLLQFYLAEYFCSPSVHIGLCLQMGSVVDFPQFDQFTIFLFLQFIFLGSGTWINRPPSRAERRASFPIWCEFGAYWCYWEALPWEVFDAFHEGLFECVAPYVVDDEVGGGVDDEAEVVDAGQTELPGCRAWTITFHVLPENGKTLGGKVSEPVSITHLAFFSTLRNSSKFRITRGMLLKRKTQTMHIRIIARFTF